MSYQFLPPLTDAEYEALRADIAANGMRHPILVDEKGKILDGHHRARIAGELGFKPEREVIAGLTETEKRDMAFTLNTARRHMDREQRRAAIVASLKADPQLSDRQHARRTGVSHPTVAGVRSELEASGRLESFTSRRSADGRERPATQPETPARRDPEQLPPEAPAVATTGGPAQDRPSATAEEAAGQPASPGPAAGPREAEEPSPAHSSAAGTAAELVTPADGRGEESTFEHSAVPAPAGEPVTRRAGSPVTPTAVEGSSGTSADARGKGPADGPDRPAAAPAPAVGDPAGAGVNPLDDPEQIDADHRRRTSQDVAAGLVNLFCALDPDPIAWLDRWIPDAYRNRGIPFVEDILTPTGLRTIAKHLDVLADHIDSTGKPL